jgi:hypothetical protein
MNNVCDGGGGMPEPGDYPEFEDLLLVYKDIEEKFLNPQRVRVGVEGISKAGLSTTSEVGERKKDGFGLGESLSSSESEDEEGTWTWAAHAMSGPVLEGFSKVEGDDDEHDEVKVTEESIRKLYETAIQPFNFQTLVSSGSSPVVSETWAWDWDNCKVNA